MYAVVRAKGRQFRVEEGTEVVVDRVDAEVGATVELDEVLLVGGDETVVGAPLVAGAKVVAEVVDHHLGDKRITYKYRRTRRYRKTRGFRPSHTTLRVTSIAR